MKRVLNLYAGIGGNRKLWTDVKVTAIEWKPDIAEAYKMFFPDDEVIVTDAHKFLEEHYNEYDFIWSSPPCPTHSRIRKNTAVETGKVAAVFPNMMLYEEILFLQGYFKGKWCVENVISWYDPLIKPFELQRHYFWSNFHINKMSDLDEPNADRICRGDFEFWEKNLGFDLSKTKVKDKALAFKNCVNPKLGNHIFNCAYKVNQQLFKFQEVLENEEQN